MSSAFNKKENDQPKIENQKDFINVESQNNQDLEFQNKTRTSFISGIESVKAKTEDAFQTVSGKFIEQINFDKKPDFRNLEETQNSPFNIMSDEEDTSGHNSGDSQDQDQIENSQFSKKTDWIEHCEEKLEIQQENLPLLQQS